MKGVLNQEQIKYMLYHLQQHMEFNEDLKNSMVFLRSGENIDIYSNKIIFLLSETEFSLEEVKWIGNLPVLFPLAQTDSFFHLRNGNIVFHHDILKSSFYLLSGFQEQNVIKRDSLGRFPYESSVQSKLNIVHKPVVNYYFEEIIKGIEEFCALRSINLKRKTNFKGFAFFLTHDVDRIKYYNLNSFLYTAKLLFGLSKSDKTKSFLVKELLKIGFNILNVFSDKDPFWNFKHLAEIEKKLGLRSGYFFLPKDRKHVDSYYRLTDKKIRKLIGFLMNEGDEIGLHGTVRSHNSPDALKKIYDEFLLVSGQKQVGIRQHRLMWDHPATAVNQENVGFLYDSSLGFAAHEGFRNSYCHPFRLFDFEHNRMLSYWEIPLNVMDSTLFQYRKLTTKEAMSSIEGILDEIKKFNGVFTLLWHNSYLNEDDVPGIENFYINLLQRIMNEKPVVVTGLEIIDRYKGTV
jgi:hypothetical protein